MDSFNNGTNKIVPIETIESGISNLDLGNQIVPLSKTEQPSKRTAFVRQISNTADIKTDSVHYISWLFGILLTCTVFIPTMIVPWHNILKEPFYMYELYVYFALPWVPILVATLILQVEYWAGIKHDKKINLFFILIGIGEAIYAVVALIYFYIYVYYFELFAPLPYGGLVPGAFSGFVLIPILFFRYHHSY